MPILIDNLDSLNTKTQELITIAKKISIEAYNKYSKFNVGAAILCKSGKIYQGTFMENVSLGLTICAETAAATAANTAGEKQILEIAIVGGKEGNSQIITPCGRCRQILYEYACIGENDFAVYCSNYDLSKVVLATISELLPVPFGPNQLLS